MQRAHSVATRPLRILELIDDASLGGGQRHVLLLSRGLRKYGFDVHVACAGEGYLVDALKQGKIPVHAVRLSNVPSWRSLTDVVRLFKRERFDLVHTHGGTAGFWGRCAAVWTRVPLRIHTYHGLHSLYRRETVRRVTFRLIDRILALFTDYILCVSQGDYDAAAQHGLLRPGKASMVRNGIELSRFLRSQPRETIRRAWGFTRRDFVIGSIGRLEWVKGYHDLVKAIPMIRKQFARARFLLVGDGPSREELESMARSMGVSPWIRFAGDRSDSEKLLAAMDLFVLPSVWEGMPLVLLEASAAGKPIVATRTTGACEFIEDGRNGFLVQIANPGELSAAVLNIAQNPRLRGTLARRARDKVRSGFSDRRMVKETAEVYSSIAHRKNVQGR